MHALNGWLLLFLEFLREPLFDLCLPRQAFAPGYAVNTKNHPVRDVQIDSFLFEQRTTGLGQIKVIQHVVALVKPALQILGCRLTVHNMLSAHS